MSFSDSVQNGHGFPGDDEQWQEHQLQEQEVVEENEILLQDQTQASQQQVL